MTIDIDPWPSVSGVRVGLYHDPHRDRLYTRWSVYAEFFDGHYLAPVHPNTIPEELERWLSTERAKILIHYALEDDDRATPAWEHLQRTVAEEVPQCWDANIWVQGDPYTVAYLVAHLGFEETVEQETHNAFYHTPPIHLDEANLRSAIIAVAIRNLVVVETMPRYLRTSHEVAGNSGAYPHNGAERYLALRDDADRAIEEDPDWTLLVKDYICEDDIESYSGTNPTDGRL